MKIFEKNNMSLSSCVPDITDSTEFSITERAHVFKTDFAAGWGRIKTDFNFFSKD